MKLRLNLKFNRPSFISSSLLPSWQTESKIKFPQNRRLRFKFNSKTKKESLNNDFIVAINDQNKISKTKANFNKFRQNIKRNTKKIF